ncbi:cupin domain-containing protein [Streptococcus ferus]|uniref:cupin domain-containing protein n=1 Tax=Streptococcus ferus TaxID=1345 RepID=UPI00235360CD|nr:cupin domain-containing protein [Streptococcus ferus]
MVKYQEVKDGIIFPRGSKNDAYAAVFTGQSYLEALASAPNGREHVGNVTFEPGCRNHWHVHTEGYQILLVTGGEGLYQEEGKPARLLHPGDVVVTDKGVKHWHGATKDAWFVHLAITSGASEFLEAVTDQEYSHAQETAKAD